MRAGKGIKVGEIVGAGTGGNEKLPYQQRAEQPTALPGPGRQLRGADACTDSAKWIQRQDLAAAKVTQLSMAIAMMVTALASGVLRILALEDGEIVAHSRVCPHWRGQLFGRAGGVCVSGAGLRGRCRPSCR